MKEALYEKVFKLDNFSRTYLLFLPYLLTNQHSITHSLILQLTQTLKFMKTFWKSFKTNIQMQCRLQYTDTMKFPSQLS